MHILGEMFNRSAGVKIGHVPYRGVAPAITDVLGGGIKDDGQMGPAAKTFRGEEDGRVMVGVMRTRAAGDAEAHFAVPSDLPVDFAVAPALGHEEGVEGAVETVDAHPDGHGQGLGFAGNIQAHAIAHIAEFEGVFARPAAGGPGSADDAAVFDLSLIHI